MDEYTVQRKGRPVYDLPAKKVKVTIDCITKYARIMMTRDTGTRHNLLLHRAVYCAFNCLDYTDNMVIVCHINDDRNNNCLDNLY